MRTIMATAAGRHRTSRLIGLIGVMALSALALSGCIKLDATVAINSDAKASGVVGIELEKQAASFLGIDGLESFDSEMTSGSLTDESGLGGLTDCSTSETETGYLYSCTFTDQEFTQDGELWTITREGDSIVFRMASEGQSSTDGADALLGEASLGSINVDVTFPGVITEVSGEGAEKTSDTTATISGDLSDTLDVTITSESSTGGVPWSILIVLLVLLAVIILIIVVAVVMISRRRRAVAAPDQPLDDGSGPIVVEPVKAIETTGVAEATPETTVDTAVTIAETDATDATDATSALDTTAEASAVDTTAEVSAVDTTAADTTAADTTSTDTTSTDEGGDTPSGPTPAP
jgi:hypothetical protein